MDPEFIKIAEHDLRDGQHRNPNEHPAYFTTAYLHRPEELESEIEAVGFDVEVYLVFRVPVGCCKTSKNSGLIKITVSGC